jgi:4-amino-4-deoxy-L-arabinose transferase-like glycosyltransferase
LSRSSISPPAIRAADATAILLVTAVAVAFRLLYVLAYPQIDSLCPDCEVYDRVGVHLAAGDGFVDESRDAESHGGSGPVVSVGPVYPGFLAGIYRTVGRRFEVVRVVQAVLGALLVPLMWHLAGAAFGSAAARVCAWLVAVSPPLITYSGMLLTEVLSAALLVASIWLFVTAAARDSRTRFVAAGLTAGVLVLLREEMLLVIVAVAAAGLWKRRPALGPAPLLAFALSVAACVGVWTARNYIVFHRPILVTAHGGETLWISTKGWNEWRFDDPRYRRLVEGRDYIERDAVLRRDAVRTIAAAPLQYAVLCLERLPQLWISSHTSYVQGLWQSFGVYRANGAYGRVAVKALLLAVNTALLAAAVWGAVLIRRSTGGLSFEAWILAIPILSISLVHFFLFATSRYQVPVLPFVAAFAAVALSRVASPTRLVHGVGTVGHAA